MADISKIIVKDLEYSLKDITAREDIAAIKDNTPVVNVLDNGLVNDGETDNYDAFATLYEANPYSTLYFP